MLKFLFIISVLTSNLSLADDELLEQQLMGEVEYSSDSELTETQIEAKYLEPSEEVNFDQNHETEYTKADIGSKQISDSDFPEINFDEIDKLRKKDKEQDFQIQKIIHAQSFRKFNFAEKEALKIKLKHIVTSGTYLANVRRGTQLVHLRTGKIHYTQKDLTVKAYRKSDYEGYKLLINKNGFSTYKVKDAQVNAITEITKLYEPPLKHTPVIKKKVQFRIRDNDLKFKTHFNFHFGLTDPKFISDLGNMENHVGQTVRYEASVYGDFDFPIETGLTIQWENMFGQLSSGGQYNSNALSIGPSFKSTRFKMGSGFYKVIAQARLAAFSKIAINSTAYTANFSSSQTSVVLGLEREFKTLFGKILIGGNYQRQWLKPSSENYIAQVSTHNNYNDSYVLTIGHGADWIW